MESTAAVMDASSGRGTPRLKRVARLRLTQEDAAVAKIWGLSKAEANYRPAPRPGVRCRDCKFMFPPLTLGGCRLVRGLIHGDDTCNEFVPRGEATSSPS